MPNNNFRSLVQSQFELFRKSYRDSKLIFENIEVKNNLLHAGEYGAYREKICKNLIRTSIPEKYSIADGFIINSKGKTSNQLDLIIYDKKQTPFIRLDDNPRFFPVETVVGIGEVKSTLTTNNLCKALVKLSLQKEIRTGLVESIYCINKENAVPNFQNPYDNIFSFIICEKISDFDMSTFESKTVESYEKNNIYP